MQFILTCSNHLSFCTPSLLPTLGTIYLPSCHLSPAPVSPLIPPPLLSSGSQLNNPSPLPSSTPSSFPSPGPLFPLPCLTQAGGTCGPSSTVPCRMLATCTCWWRRRRSRQFAEPSWRRGAVTVPSLTCFSLWWWGTFTLCYAQTLSLLSLLMWLHCNSLHPVDPFRT